MAQGARRSRSPPPLRPVAFRLILVQMFLYNKKLYRFERFPFMYFRSKEVAEQQLDELVVELFDDMDMEDREQFTFRGQVEAIF